MTIFIWIAVILAFFLPMAAVSIVERIINKKPYTFLMLFTSVALAFIVFTLCMYTF